MEYKLTIIDAKGADLGKIKESGFDGVIFTENFENIKDAKKRKLKTFLHINNFSREECMYLDSYGAGYGDFFGVTLEMVKDVSAKSDLDKLDGFVIPVPFPKGLLWSDELPQLYEEICGKDIKDEIPDLFDKDVQDNDFRVWYYTIAAELLFLKYILPLSEYIAGLGKKACFDFGNAGSGIELIKKQLNPFLLQKHKIPIIYETQDGITLVYGRRKRKPNLLVLPLRAVMRGYAYGAKYSRQESPLVLALAEEEYYKNTLKRCKIEYKAVDEFEFLKMKTGELRGFDNILICDSCSFSDKERERIMLLKKDGCNVNNRDFLDILDRAN